MVFDLRGALLKKEEVESARLADFEFRLRVRTMRLLAPMIGEDVDTLVNAVALYDDDRILADLQGAAGLSAARLGQDYAHCRVEARTQLIAERGDPSPHRLA